MATQNSEIHYVYSFTLQGFLEDQLRYFNNKKILDGKKLSGGTKEISKYEKMEINKTKTLLQRRKVDVLNKHIFRSMANLILFFEYIAKYPELRELFDDDVKELFGYIRNPPDLKKGESSKYNAEYSQRNAIMHRFLDSLLHWDLEQDPNNFRLELLQEIYSIFTRYLISLILTENNEKLPQVIVNSIEHVEYLIKQHSKDYVKSGNKKRDLEKLSNRSICFDPPK
ncbi:MAG TPA: hypothetical protein VFV86_10560 [Nitrososphaeraceae archaeon]|nr:hypothetical protein [Nitrososphaeraceae archaeon]